MSTLLSRLSDDARPPDHAACGVPSEPGPDTHAKHDDDALSRPGLATCGWRVTGTADVTAVLVAHDGAAWLPEALAALAAQTIRPVRVIAVDTGSTDATSELLAGATGEVVDRVVTLGRAVPFGAAVHAGLEAEVDAHGGPAALLWLLHDDVAPDPDALERLLAYADDSPSAALLGPKVRDWHDPRLLVEIGLTTDGTGRRDLGLERHEYDQGQHDDLREVLAVGTAGALVRRSVWDAVGGLDPRLPLFRDDLDLGWRVNAAGHRVVVVPRATVRHVRAATTGRRHVDAVHGRAEGIDRRHALHVLYAHAPLWALPLMTIRLLVATVLRVLGYLLTRRPLEARDELAAVGRLLLRPGVMARARRSRARTRTQPRSAIRPLFASRRSRIRARLQTLGAYVEGERAPASSRLGALGDAGPEASDAFDDDGASGAGLLNRIFWRPSFLVVAILAAVTAVAARDVLPVGGGVLAGGRLLPAPDSAHALWEQYTSAWHPVSVGSADPASPAIALLAVLSNVLFGKAWLAVDLLLLGSIPLAGLTAYLAAGRLVRRRSLRVWAALTWALLPVATGAIATGRLDAAVVQIALPPLVVAGARLLSRDPAEAGWRHAWGLGLGLAVVAAFAPLMWALASAVLVLGGLAGLGFRGGLTGPGALRRLLAAVIVAASSFALLMPWSTHVFRHPDLALAGPGRLVADPALADPRLPGFDLLLLSPGGAGLPALVVTIGLLLAALAALFRDARHGLTVAAWVVAAGSFGVALALSRTSVTVPPSGAQAPVWPGPALQLAGAALVVAALVGGEDLRTRLGRTSFGWRQLSAGLVAVLAATVPLAAGAAWLAGDGQDPLRRDSLPVLPAFVRAELDAAPGLRVLALQADAQEVSYSLYSAAGNRIGSTDTPPTGGQRDALDAAVADLLTPSGSPGAEVLSTRAVRYIALPVVPDSDASRQVTAVLDAQSGLVRRGRGDVLLWEVVAPASRLTVLPAPAAAAARQGSAGLTGDLLRAAPPEPIAGRTHAVVPAGGPDRLLVLAEAADPGWRAELDGRALEPVTAWGWAAGFALPEGGGAVTLRFDPQGGRRTALWLQLAALVVVAAFALPGARRRRGLEVADPEPRSSEEGSR